jgi:exonuclease III
LAQQYRGRYQESNTSSRRGNYQADRWNYRPRREDDEMEELPELTMISLNIRGFNSEEKHHVIGQLIHDNECHVVCLNETKLTIPVYLDNYWSHQTLLQRNGGAWTAATNKVKLTLVKALGTYLCWTRVTTGKQEVQILNCCLEPGNEPFKTERAKRITDIIKDIIKQDADAAIVVCGDFNNHINHIYRELSILQFKHAID